MIRERAQTDESDSLRENRCRRRVHCERSRGDVPAQEVDHALIRYSISSDTISAITRRRWCYTWHGSVGEENALLSRKLLECNGQEETFEPSDVANEAIDDRRTGSNDGEHFCCNGIREPSLQLPRGSRAEIFVLIPFHVKSFIISAIGRHWCSEVLVRSHYVLWRTSELIAPM